MRNRYSRSGESHAPEDGLLVGLEGLTNSHLVLRGICLGCFLDDIGVELAGEIVGMVSNDDVLRDAMSGHDEGALGMKSRK